MKNKLQLSNKVSLKQQWLYASFGIGAIAVVVALIFIYLNSEKAVAAGDGESCVMTINSTKGHSISINVEPIRFVDFTCYGTSYRYRIQFKYEMEYTGTGTPNFYDLKGSYTYEGATFEFPMNDRFEGIHTTYSCVYQTYKDCATADLNLIEDIKIYIATDGISGQTIQCSEILLPISLLEFKAEKEENSINLDWSTAAEINNDFFTLERSNDGKAFETVATIDGAGNSNQKIDYEFEDKNPRDGYNYYRLKQTDYNGDFEYFNIVVINNEISSTSSTDSEVLIVGKAYPNPFKNEINLSFEAQAEENIEVMIQDSRGDIVYSESVAIHQGTNEYKFSKADKLAAGVYYVNVKSNLQKYRPQRIIKL